MNTVRIYNKIGTRNSFRWEWRDYLGALSDDACQVIHIMEEAMGYDPGTMELRVSISDCSMPNAMHLQRTDIVWHGDWGLYAVAVGERTHTIHFCSEIGRIVTGAEPHYPQEFWVRIIEHSNRIIERRRW